MNKNPIDSIGAVRREVRACERDGRPARAVVAERTYDTTVDDMWDALTNRERIPRWFLPVEGDLELGGRYQLVGNAGGVVTTCDKPTHLAVTWEFGGGISWVDVHLSDDPGGGTRLRLEHVAPIGDDDRWDEYGPGAVGVGWDLGLLGLAEHVRTGGSVDPDAIVGPAVMAGSSDAWYEAAVAFGTPEPAARAAADRTTAFYTGDGEAPAGEEHHHREAPDG